MSEDTERLALPDGQHATLKLRYSYGSDLRIAGAWGFTDDPAAFENACRVTLQESVTDAALKDVAGSLLPFGPDIWEQVDGRIGRRIFRRARANWRRWQKDADPEGSGETSSGS